MGNTNNYIFDANLQLKDAGAIAADAAATVASVARIIDLGDADVSGDVVIDITAIEIDTAGDGYMLILEGSDSADFSAGTPRIVPLAILAVGDDAFIPGAGATDSPVGRYILPFRNTYGIKRSRYVRMYTDVTGTIATGINYTAYISVHRPGM